MKEQYFLENDHAHFCGLAEYQLWASILKTEIKTKIFSMQDMHLDSFSSERLEALFQAVNASDCTTLQLARNGLSRMSPACWSVFLDGINRLTGVKRIEVEGDPFTPSQAKDWEAVIVAQEITEYRVKAPSFWNGRGWVPPQRPTAPNTLPTSMQG